MAKEDYKLCPFMVLAEATSPTNDGDGMLCWEGGCAWYDEDAEMCAVPMLSCSMWEIVRLLQRRTKP